MVKKRIVDNDFSKKIALIAKEKFGSQKKMAEAVGVSPSNVSDWTKGKIMPSLTVLKELCIKADISLDWLLLDKDDKQEFNPFEFAKISMEVHKWALANKIEISDSLIVGIYTTFQKNRKDHPSLSITEFLDDCRGIFKNIRFYD